MKRQFFNRSINLLFLLIFSVACSKSVDQPSNTVTRTNAPPPPRTVSVVVDNWVKVDQGKYVSDLYAAIKKNAYNFSTIINVTVNEGQIQVPLQSGTALPLQGGDLILSGTTLYFNSYTYYGQYGLPISSLSLNVTIN